MRHRPIQAAPRERVPFTLWGHKRIRQTLATVAAAAAGLVPVVFVGSPAMAAANDYLTITPTSNWEGGDISYKLTYTGTVSATFTIAAQGGSTAVGASTLNPAVGNTDYDSDDVPGSLQFAAASANSPATSTITIHTASDTDTGDETLILRATNSAYGTNSSGDASYKEASATIYGNAATNNITLSGGTTVSEGAKTVTITATSSTPQTRAVSIPIKTADFLYDVDSNSGTADAADYTGQSARSTGDAFRDYTALASDAVITIPANATSGSATIDINDDTADETDTQNFLAQVDTARSTLGGVVGGQTSVQYGITDNDAKPTVSVGDAASVTEGAPLIFPLTLTNPSERTVSVTFGMSGVATSTAAAATVGTANSSPNDLYWTSGAQTVPAYSLSSNVFVPTTAFYGTSAWEGPENARATISGGDATVATLGKTTGNGVITDAEAGPVVYYGTAANPANNSGHTFATEGDTTTTSANIYVRFASNSPLPAVLDYKFVDGTATNGVDYKGTNGTITLASGTATDVAIPVSIIGDRISEANETFKLNVTSASGVVGTASLGDQEFTITDNDTPPTWTTSDVSIAEGNTGVTTAKVPVSISAPSGVDTTFDATVTAGSAVDVGVNTGNSVGANDYDQPVSRTVTIKAGETTGYLEVPINADVVYERDELFTVAFALTSTNVNSTQPPEALGSARVIVTNDDAKPTMTFNSVAGTEGGSVRVNGTLVGLSQYPYTLGITVAGSGDNPASASDFEVPTAIITTPISVTQGQTGALTASIGDIYLSPDDIDEPMETFTVSATETTPSLTGFTTGTGIYRINDDPADVPPAASIRDETIKENEGSVDVHVDLKFDENTKETAQTVEIPYKTVDGSAKAGQDYESTSGVLKVAPGTTTATISVEILNDKMKESNEDFYVKLDTPTPSGAMVTKGTGEVTIYSDDVAEPVTPTLMVSGPAKGAGMATLSGKAAPNTNVEIWGAKLPQTDPKKMSHLGNVMSSASGAFSYKSMSLTQGWAFAVQAEDMTSTVRTVKLAQSPALTLGTTKGKLNVIVYGNPKAVGQTVTVQRLVGKKWTTIGSGKTTSSGYRKTVAIKSKTKVSVRALVSGNSGMGIASGYSTTKTITIK
jgi:hypothetical protein